MDRFKRMPRYFFHLFNDIDARDHEGLELADVEAAIEQGRINARAMAAQAVCDGKLNLNHRVVVQDETGSIVQTIRFRDVVEVQD